MSYVNELEQEIVGLYDRLAKTEELRDSLEERNQEIAELRGRLAEARRDNADLQGYAVDAAITAALLTVAAAFFLAKWQGWI